MVEKLGVECRKSKNTDLYVLFSSSILLLLAISENFYTYVYVYMNINGGKLQAIPGGRKGN